MQLLDKLLGRKSRPVGQNLERGDDPAAARRRQLRVAVKGGLFLVLTALTVLAFPGTTTFRYAVEVGDVWTDETLVAPYSYPIVRPARDVEREKARIRRSVQPYFTPVTDARSAVRSRRDTLESALASLFETYASYRLNESRGRNDQASADSAWYVVQRQNAPVRLSTAQWDLLAADYVRRSPGAATATREPPADIRLDERLLAAAFEAASRRVVQGVIDMPVDSIRTSSIIVRDRSNNKDRAVPRIGLLSVDQAVLLAETEFRTAGMSALEARTAAEMVRAMLVPTYVFDETATMAAIREAEEVVEINEGIVREGEVIVRQGDQVTDDTYNRIESFLRKEETRTGSRNQWTRSAGQALLVLSIYTFFFLYLFLLRRQVFDNNRYLMMIVVLFAAMIGLFGWVSRLDFVGLYVVPLAIVAIILAVIFDSRVGLFATLTLALIGGAIGGLDYEFVLATVFAATLGVYSVRDIKNRGQFFLSAGLVFAGYATVLVGTSLLRNRGLPALDPQILTVGLNSFLVIIAWPLLWIFERAFGITTDLTLLELSDTNRPVLKELAIRAPGTFNHTLQVANLAEAAADAIGANALLTRVGALYHDIGKMAKPEYFVENQRAGLNPHDDLKPRMSALIIASHVKEGIELGKQHRLPEAVLDFIPMHHGTSLIEYFYRRAQDRTDGGKLLHEGEFRYPGPRPDSRETGILMLADGVEAASRSLDAPSHKRLETLVGSIVDGRIADDQLAGTDLTFRDVTRIKEAFISMLVSMYHVRVKYPGQEKGDRPDAGSAEKEPEAPASVRAGAAFGLAARSTSGAKPKAEAVSDPEAVPSAEAAATREAAPRPETVSGPGGIPSLFADLDEASDEGGEAEPGHRSEGDGSSSL